MDEKPVAEKQERGSEVYFVTAAVSGMVAQLPGAEGWALGGLLVSIVLISLSLIASRVYLKRLRIIGGDKGDGSRFALTHPTESTKEEAADD